MAGFPPEAPTCVEFARDEKIDPVGTAGGYLAVALVELPLPWPQDIGELALVAPAAPALAKANIRVQAVVPGPGSKVERRRLAVYSRPTGPFQCYSRHEAFLAERQIPEALSDLAISGSAPVEGGGPGTGAPPLAPSSAEAITEVLVCSHGKRDACCGTLGTRLVTTLEADEVGERMNNGAGGVRLWRTSHTGGHRFAPTALVLPQGTAWAYLDGGRLEGIIDRSLTTEVAASLYRGCTGLAHPAVQACEREAFRKVGWSWFDHHRSGEVLAEEGGVTRVRLDHTSPDGTRGTFEATVEVARRLPVPLCRQPLTESRKDAPELAVTSFAEA